MCRERAHLAKREFEYWLAEADEWARYRNSTDPSIEAIPTQLDWCVESPSIIKIHKQPIWAKWLVSYTPTRPRLSPHGVKKQSAGAPAFDAIN
jgi:hypothetical protein